MADIDDDGDMDLLVGDSFGYITVYIRNEDGDLNSIGHLEVDGEELDVEDRAAPETVDWDLDGDLDLLVGNSLGTVLLLLNVGNAEEYEFTLEGTLSANDEEISLGGETAPKMIDLDGDGKRDLIVGNIWGDLMFYPNTGEDDDPEFGEGVALADAEGDIYLYSYSRPEVVDWDGDGDLDLIAGFIDSEVRLFVNPTISGISDDKHYIATSPVLFSTYPEPFNSTLNLTVELATPAALELRIIGLDGTLIRHEYLGSLAAGMFERKVSFSAMPSGKYVLNLWGGTMNLTTTVTLVR